MFLCQSSFYPSSIFTYVNIYCLLSENRPYGIKKAYQRSKRFKLIGTEVIELIFADESDEDGRDLNADDIEFLESAVDENVEIAIILPAQTDGTFATGDDCELSE